MTSFSLRRLAAVAGREFRGYFDQPTAYILLVVFLAANFFFFFRTAFLTAEASLRPMFDLMPWMLVFLVPAVTMRSIAEDRASGTLELTLAQPVLEAEVLLGKFVGTFAFLSVALLGTAAAWFALAAGGDPLVGVAVAQYAGTLLLCAALVAIGLWASAAARNQITAFVLAVAIGFTLVAVTMPLVLVGLPPAAGAVAQRLGILTHYRNITRGVVDFRDVLYFASLAVAFLSLAYLLLLRGRRNASSSAFRMAQTGVLLVVLATIVVNLLGQQVRGRLDLTPGGAYTLAEPTRRLLDELPDVVTIRWFASEDLPPQAEMVRRDVEDLLRDFDAAGGREVRLLRRRPASGNEDAVEAERVGIPAVQFNTMGQDQLQVSQGYLGIVLEYADASEVLPFIQQTADLEYRLARAIRSMVVPGRPVVGLMSGFGGPPQDTVGGPGAEGILGFARALTESYDVRTVDLGPDSLETGALRNVPEDVDVLVVAGPETEVDGAAVDAVRRFLDRGGNVFLMYQLIGIGGSQQFTVPASQPGLDGLLAPYGVRVAPGMIADLRSNEPLTIDGALRPFPLFPVVVPPRGTGAESHPIVTGLAGVSLEFASPLDLSAADTTTVVPLLATTEAGGVLPPESPLDPQIDWSRMLDPTSLRPRPAAAAVLPRGPDAPAAGGPGAGGRLVLVGDAGFLTNRFIARAPQNLVFGRNAVDWLASDEALIGIRAKQRQAPSLLYPSAAVRDAAKYLTLIGVPVLVILYGVVRLFRRRRKTRQPWASEAS